MHVLIPVAGEQLLAAAPFLDEEPAEPTRELGEVVLGRFEVQLTEWPARERMVEHARHTVHHDARALLLAMVVAFDVAAAVWGGESMTDAARRWFNHGIGRWFVLIGIVYLAIHLTVLPYRMDPLDKS